MADRYLSDSQDRSNQSRDTSRPPRKRRIRVTQNGQPGNEPHEAPAPRQPTPTVRASRPATESSYGTTAARSTVPQGYDDYLDDDYFDDDEFLEQERLERGRVASGRIDSGRLDDELLDEFETRRSARRPTVNRRSRQSRSAEYEVEEDYDTYRDARYVETQYDTPRSRARYDDRGYAPRTSLRSQLPSMSLPNMSLPGMSMPRRPRMPQLPMRGGLSDLVGRGRVAMAILMGLLAFVGYNVSRVTVPRSNLSRNQTQPDPSFVPQSSVRQSSVHRRPAPQQTGVVPDNRYARAGVNTSPQLVVQHDIALGPHFARNIVDSHGGLSQDRNLRVRIQQIGSRLVDNSSARNTAFKFYFDVLAESGRVAAYDVPGGHVYLTTGLISKLSSDDEIAAILAHEMAHITNRHAVRRLAHTRLPGGSNAGVVMASFLDPVNYQSTKADLSQLVREASAIQYDTNEIQRSDEGAIGFLVESNIDPNALITALQRVNQVNGRSTVYAARHPSSPNRYAVIQQQIERIMFPSGT